MRSLAPRLISAAALVLAACAAPGAPIPSAVPPPATPTDSAAASRARAAELLAASADALGGRAAVLGATGVELRLATTTRGGWQQARRWTDSTSIIPGTFVLALDVANRRARRETVSVSPGQIRFHFLSVFDGGGAWQVDRLRWRLGDDVVRATAAGARGSLAGFERLVPHLAVRQGLGAAGSLRDGGVASREGRAVHVVTWADPATGQPVRLELDAATRLPAAVTGDAPGAMLEFDDYRLVDGLRVPHRQVVRVGAVAAAERRVERVVVQPTFAESLFALPAGYADPPPAGAPRATRLAEGVYRLDGMPAGYHALFVVGAGGVDVLEAPQSPAYTAAALELVRRTAPGLPVRRVFLTHHHGDHVGGLLPYVRAGATVVVGAGLEGAIRRQLADSLSDSLRAALRIETVERARTFGAGAARIEALPVPNTHADGNLAYWLPVGRVLFQGDLFYIPERGAVPPAFEVTESLARVVRERRLAVEHVVGVHGRTGTWAEVEASLRRRAGR